MATGYQAIVRLTPVDISPEREDGVLQLIRQDLPAGARIAAKRDDQDQAALLDDIAVKASS